MADERIAMLSSDEASVAATDAGVPEYVTALNLNRVLLRHPGMARRFVDYFTELMFHHQLPARARELAIMRVGWVTGSVYEWTQHWHLAVGIGVSEDDLVAVRGDWRAHDGFSPADRAVLEATDEVLDRGRIGPEVWGRCADHFEDPAQMIELLLVISGWRMVATVLQSLEVPLEKGVEPWPPDGRAPATAGRDSERRP